MEQETFTWFAAVDWGSEKHQGCVLDARGGIAGEREFPHSGAGLAELCDITMTEFAYRPELISLRRGQPCTSTSATPVRSGTTSRRPSQAQTLH